MSNLERKSETWVKYACFDHFEDNLYGEIFRSNLVSFGILYKVYDDSSAMDMSEWSLHVLQDDVEKTDLAYKIVVN